MFQVITTKRNILKVVVKLVKYQQIYDNLFYPRDDHTSRRQITEKKSQQRKIFMTALFDVVLLNGL